MNSIPNLYVVYFADIYGESYGKFGELYEVSSRLMNYFELDSSNQIKELAVSPREKILPTLAYNLKDEILNRFNIGEIKNFRINSPFISSVEIEEYKTLLSCNSIDFEFIVHLKAFSDKDKYLKCIEDVLKIPDTMECSKDNRELDKCKNCPYYFYLCKQSKIFDYEWDNTIKLSGRCEGGKKLKDVKIQTAKIASDFKITA